jgi:tetraacyldisaccharide 4'-kinase
LGQRADRWRHSLWGGGGGPGFALARGALLPLEALYRAGVGLRNRAFDVGLLRSAEPPIPVVSVGNLTVGGTGKTPVTAWVVTELTRLGANPAVVSRGYGEDEIALHRQWHPQVPVLVAPRRIEGIREAARSSASVAVLDDGFQHRWVRRSLDVVLLAAEQPFPAPVLPRGPGREPAGALRRADWAVITRKAASDGRVEAVAAEVAARHPSLPVAHLTLAPDGWVSLAGGAAEPPGAGVLVVASVAQPETVAALVRATTGHEPDVLAYPDHYRYRAPDARRIREVAGNRTVVTTEKDAVKLRPLADAIGDARVLRLAVRPGSGSQDLRARLARVVEAGAGR